MQEKIEAASAGMRIRVRRVQSLKDSHNLASLVTSCYTFSIFLKRDICRLMFHQSPGQQNTVRYGN
jgi:hypothetical protein